MSLNSVGDSDMAADLQARCHNAFLAALAEGLREEANAYNTSGWVNVALMIEHGDLDNIHGFIQSMEKFDWKFLVAKLKEDIINSSYAKRKDWDDDDNRKEHNAAYRRMLKSVIKFLKEKELSYTI